MITRILFFIFTLFNFVNYSNASIQIVAKVGSDIITNADIADRMKLLAFTKAAKNNDHALLIQLAGVQLVNESVYNKIAKKHNITVTSKYTDIAEQNVSNNFGFKNLDDFSKQTGISVKHIKEYIKNELLWQKIIQKQVSPRIKVSDAEFVSFVNDSKKLEFNFITTNLTDEQVIKLQINNTKNNKTCSEVRKYLVNKFNVEVDSHYNLLFSDLHPFLVQVISTLNVNEFSISKNVSSSNNNFVMLCYKGVKFDSNEEKNFVMQKIIDAKTNLEAAKYLDQQKKSIFIELK
jgi:hypothetical protein